MIYLDSAATTRVDPEVLEAMLPYLTDEYGNAGTLYKLGKNAANAIQTAREQVALLFGGNPENIIFTSCGSEGNSMVFHGLGERFAGEGKLHMIVSAVEHDSVTRAGVQLMKRRGFDVTIVYPDNTGVIQPQEVERAIRENTAFVSVMYANNETGAVNDIHTIGQICRSHGVLFHTDCVHAAGQFLIDVERDFVDFATISGHKLYAPKGVGALYARGVEAGVDRFAPLVCGGRAQEFGLRGGTENVPGIVALGKACEMLQDDLRYHVLHLSTAKQVFYAELRERLTDHDFPIEAMHVNGLPVTENGKTLNLRFDGVDAETLVLMLDAKGVCVSAGSACSSHEKKPSHVLKAMGLTDDEARSSVRFSFSKFNTKEEAVEAAGVVAECVGILRHLSKRPEA